MRIKLGIYQIQGSGANYSPIM